MSSVCPNTKEQLARWAEHFKELLNRPPPDITPDINKAKDELKVNLHPPSKIEIKQAIKKIKSAKSSGPDNIPPEALKANPDLTANILHKIFNSVWKDEEMPQNWNSGHLIKLPKKGNLKECKNYRGIALLSVVAKVLNRIILTRLLKAIHEKLRDQQAGFRKDRSCTDQIATLRIIIEQSLEWNTSPFLNFSKQPISIKIRDTIQEEVEEFTYLGSIVSVNGGTDADVKTRINKARVIFNILGKVWNAKNISRNTKIKCKVCFCMGQKHGERQMPRFQKFKDSSITACAE
ncbi:uncharacterized protein LOC130047042 [Ostrea edulis]|uniref:uncharacterized protein LOC130047042 n=1 Tax=Ostrea edulis TaxID=37623 RepID=UPI0024AEFC59|nr:uncharacterized protein LOC130047042 [Ostrea edulis]